MVEQSRNSTDGTKDGQISQDEQGFSREEDKNKTMRDILRDIMEIEFVCIDLNLYLDTHPNDQKALMDFNMLSVQLNQLKELYEMSYGPLLNFGSSQSRYPWQWIEDPWPWEIEY